MDFQEWNKGKWVRKEWSEGLSIWEWLRGRKKGRGIKGQEAVMKMGRMEITLLESTMERSDRRRRSSEKFQPGSRERMVPQLPVQTGNGDLEQREGHWKGSTAAMESLRDSGHHIAEK